MDQYSALTEEGRSAFQTPWLGSGLLRSPFTDRTATAI